MCDADADDEDKEELKSDSNSASGLTSAAENDTSLAKGDGVAGKQTKQATDGEQGRSALLPVEATGEGAKKGRPRRASKPGNNLAAKQHHPFTLTDAFGAEAAQDAASPADMEGTGMVAVSPVAPHGNEDDSTGRPADNE